VPSEEQVRADIVEIGRRLWERGYVASNDGNISVRLDERRLITTPKSVSKGFMTPDMMVVTDFEGRKLAGGRDPSSEIKMHLQVYRDRPDAGAVVHAHPPTATGFAVAGIPLDRAVLAEVVTTLGSIPIAEYATPSTDALPAACSKYLKAHDGLLLANHGALAIGPDLFTAYHRMGTIEHFAKISLVTRMLGRENLLSREEVDRLQGLRGMYGIASPAPVCTDDTVTVGARGQAECQVIQAPSAPAGTQLVVDPAGRDRRLGGGLTGVVAHPVQATRVPGRGVAAGGDGEIRLTYRELTALIEDAVRNLK
jgi:L-fuculose-phosphate aldolase